MIYLKVCIIYIVDFIALSENRIKSTYLTKSVKKCETLDF